ncbi:N-acetylglucosaminyl transferase component family protein [Myxozyma melibiosi]|uniref:N-acetylglucosaminyl transferase component family protein n=1 Tax=Myxozyma melibiosi TaxID=54550 RepID=A0ABR1EZA2_9ASCO
MTVSASLNGDSSSTKSTLTISTSTKHQQPHTPRPESSKPKKNGNRDLHLFLPPSQAMIRHGGTTISGARSVPVSSSNSPTEETAPNYHPHGRNISILDATGSSRREGTRAASTGHRVASGSQRPVPGTSEKASRKDHRKVPIENIYRVGNRRECIIYDYDAIFSYRENVKAATRAHKDKPCLTRVFWPTDCRCEKGVLVGFQNSMSDFVVIAMYSEIDVSTMRRIFSSSETVLGGDRKEEKMFGYLFDTSKLGIVGTLNLPVEEGDDLPLRVTMRPGSKPRFSHSTAGGVSTGFQVVFYERPLSRRLQYFSFIPITLELADRSSANSAEDEDDKVLKKRQDLISRIQKHTKFGFPQTDEENNSIQVWINEINFAQELDALLRDAVAQVLEKDEACENTWESLKKYGHAAGLKVAQGLSFLWTATLMMLMWVLIAGIMVYRVCSEAVLLVIEWCPKGTLPALKDVSATIQQLDLRLQQACYWPIQYITLRNQKRNLMIRTTFQPEYIRFYNSLWLVANDIIIGAAVGAYMIDNRDKIVSFVDYCIDEFLTTGLRQTIEWLMDWPGGLKLNNELVAFFGELFLWVIEFWSSTLRLLRPCLPDLIYFFGLSGFVGATFPIALIADLISFLTIQIYSCYLASARIYNWQLTSLESLFHLFRGKRRNVLRNRIDSVDYDLDQLLLGTLLFTLLTFLLPTVLVFYLTFAGSRLGIIIVNAILESSLALLNHFPLFAIMLRLKDSKRLPGGIEFDLSVGAGDAGDVEEEEEEEEEKSADGDEESTAAQVVYVNLKPVALPIVSMFQQYFLLSKRIQRHYLSLRVVSLLLTGQFVPIQRSRLYSLQYSMLPEQRFGIKELWSKLREFSRVVGSEFWEKLGAVTGAS